MNCPECGRAVPPQGTKLCPHCGYPLLLDKPAHVEVQPQKVTHKPTAEGGSVNYTGAMPAAPPPPPRGNMYAPPQPQYQQRPVQQVMRGPEPARVLGPHCPQCRQVNPPHRKRCEICGCELWPGAAFPPRWMPEPPAVASGPKRRSDWWKTALLIGLPLLAMGTVWALAYFL
ncbi:RNA polymerase subunit RPABC4/transcription elongation factor Spt4 [Kibdelosporangium banguiense]|uniref:RNA polymerase subunit RPABC4/transcription elongation factor Spt4 n=1 Tax=Kibdelosporangium banguiense TaxID=1365924 RepID=A0ABS4TZS2_9PSEU|nr:RNA polymerase subunit RPABC4/transcription elongation factor Spt4 [Kibdelosporangium banguiense]